MKISIKELLSKCGVEDSFYPGKRFVKKLPQPGEHKSHCLVGDWRDPSVIRLKVEAGLSGKTLTPRELKKYPVSFQSPSYIEIAVADSLESRREDEGEDGGSRRGDGGGGRAPLKRSLNAFSDVVKGRIPDAGEVKAIVLMGMKIAEKAFASVLDALAAQIRNHQAVAPVNLLASVSAVTKVAPGGRMKEEIDPSLLRNARPYKPQDMFGAIPTPAK